MTATCSTDPLGVLLPLPHERSTLDHFSVPNNSIHYHMCLQRTAFENLFAFTYNKHVGK